MSAITASFPAFHSNNVAFHAAVSAPALPEGMRHLSMYELDYIAGGGILDALGAALAKVVCVGVGVLVGMLNPYAGVLVGAGLSEFVDNYISMSE